MSTAATDETASNAMARIRWSCMMLGVGDGGEDLVGSDRECANCVMSAEHVQTSDTSTSSEQKSSIAWSNVSKPVGPVSPHKNLTHMDDALAAHSKSKSSCGVARTIHPPSAVDGDWP
jgi:hypothetical protein